MWSIGVQAVWRGDHIRYFWLTYQSINWVKQENKHSSITLFTAQYSQGICPAALLTEPRQIWFCSSLPSSPAVSPCNKAEQHLSQTAVIIRASAQCVDKTIGLTSQRGSQTRGWPDTGRSWKRFLQWPLSHPATHQNETSHEAFYLDCNRSESRATRSGEIKVINSKQLQVSPNVMFPEHTKEDSRTKSRSISSLSEVVSRPVTSRTRQ